MSQTGRNLGWLMAIWGLWLLTAGSSDPNGGGWATAGAILVCSVWLGFFVFDGRTSSESQGPVR